MANPPNKDNETVRLDKWLWAARFFKTRSLATTAINGGKIHVNQQRFKPSKHAVIGQMLTIRIHQTERTVMIEGLSAKRGPATVAQQLYSETEESILKREKQSELRRFAYSDNPQPLRRPTKKERRQIHRFVNQANHSE